MSIRRMLLFVTFMAVCGGLSIFVYSYGTRLLNEDAIEETGNEYMAAIQVGDFNTAYTMIDPTFQSQMGSPEGLQNLLASWAFFPASWTFHDRSIENGVGNLQGAVRKTDGGNMGVVLIFVQMEGDWRITRMEFITS